MRVVGRSVITLPAFWLDPHAKRLDEMGSAPAAKRNTHRHEPTVKTRFARRAADIPLAGSPEALDG